MSTLTAQGSVKQPSGKLQNGTHKRAIAVALKAWPDRPLNKEPRICINRMQLSCTA